MTVSFVLGNGVSRQSVKLDKLKAHGKIYACNAVYREFSPDYLVAVDTKMIIEITDTGYHLNNEVWTNPNKLTKTNPNLHLFEPNRGWSSGPTALMLASKHAAKTIYILGFDYAGLGVDNSKVNNVFAGTKNYKNVNDRATYFGNWERQTMACIKEFPKTKYVRVIEHKESFVPDKLEGLANLTHITLEKFNNKFNIL
jgi:hypothetical protein